MNKKWLLISILGISVLTIIIILVLTHKTKYNKLIVSEEKWNNIISDRINSTSIELESIKFNDYNLLIDNENSIIYYSVVNTKNKYNPSIKYSTNKKTSIVINDSITDEKLEQTGVLKIMIYNDNEYRIYTLVATNYPILNMIYNENTNNKTKIPIEIELFDNHIDSPQRIVKSTGKLRVINENREYSFSLIKESLGHNKRENHISIFGMGKRNEYVIKKVNNTNMNEKYVQVFINNKYNGLYSFGPKDERRIDNFERNRENNK